MGSAGPNFWGQEAAAEKLRSGGCNSPRGVAGGRGSGRVAAAAGATLPSRLSAFCDDLLPSLGAAHGVSVRTGCPKNI